MILSGGKIVPSSEQNNILDRLEEKINHTLSCEKLNVETVIAAADWLGQKIWERFFILRREMRTVFPHSAF